MDKKTADIDSIDLVIHNLLSKKGNPKCVFSNNTIYLEYLDEERRLFLYGLRNPDGSATNNLEHHGLVYQGKTKDGITFQRERYIKRNSEWERIVIELRDQETHLVAHV